MRILTAIIACLFFIVSCSSRMNSEEKNPPGSDNVVRSMVMLDGKLWMTENLNMDIPGSYCHLDDTLNCKEYGRLYNWEAAKKGCDMLGDSWRLPTNEEWQTMAKLYGGVYDDSEDRGRSAYEKLLVGGEVGFNAVLGGNREANGNYERLGAHGFYWTATEYGRDEAWFYNFGKGSKLLNHHTGDKQEAVSVRCIRNTED